MILISPRYIEQICPRDGKPHCSFVDALDIEGMANPSTVFQSWLWKYKVPMMVDVWGTLTKDDAFPVSTTFVWIWYRPACVHKLIRWCAVSFATISIVSKVALLQVVS